MLSASSRFTVTDGQTTLASAHRYRSVTLERFSIRSARWEWAPLTRVEPTASFVFPLDGVASVEAKEATRAGVSTAIVLHTGRAAAVQWTGPATAVVVSVPMSALSELGVGEQQLPWVTADNVLVRSTRAFFLSAVERPRDDTSLSAYFMEKLTVEMVFGISLEQEAAHTLGEAGASMVDRARSMMIVRRGDPDFTPDALAQELHVSIRQLQREFSKAGQSPGAELRRLRVEYAQALLANPDYSPLGITDIARFAGFGSASAMRRAFADHGLPAPRRHRTLSR